MTLTERIAQAKTQPRVEPVKPEMPEWRRRMLEGKTSRERYLARKDTTVQ